MDLENTPQPSPSCPGVYFAVFGPFFVSFQRRASGGRSPERFYPTSFGRLVRRCRVGHRSQTRLARGHRAFSTAVHAVMPCAELHQIVLDRFHHGLLGHVGTAALPPLRKRLRHTPSCEPVLDRDDFVVAETISGDFLGVWSCSHQADCSQATEPGDRRGQKG